ncbi:MAG: hypothetical protein IKB45_01510 [Clostridia bacterium]|nr:hypothetical protein [Clostridia bacterium]
MKAYDIYKKAAIRAGITENDILSDSFTKKGAEFINQIANDLNIAGIDSLSDKIDCTSLQAEALCCGVAMLISLTISDSEKNSVLTDIYNAKRASALSKISSVEDVIPRP